MKVDLSKKITNYLGEEVNDTFKDVILNVINTPEENESPESKTLTFKISVLLATNDVVELDVKEISHIISKAERHASPLGLGRIRELLDPESKTV